jgi:hypothetical protein
MTVIEAKDIALLRRLLATAEMAERAADAVEAAEECGAVEALADQLIDMLCAPEGRALLARLIAMAEAELQAEGLA